MAARTLVDLAWLACTAAQQAVLRWEMVAVPYHIKAAQRGEGGRGLPTLALAWGKEDRTCPVAEVCARLPTLLPILFWLR